VNSTNKEKWNIKINGVTLPFIPDYRDTEEIEKIKRTTSKFRIFKIKKD
jgi:hypothetical protein